MITLSKSGNSVTFTFDENSGYLQNGTIDVPVNSLALIIDESDMATFRKSASNDIFISANIAEFGMTKSELESWYKEYMVGSTGGGVDSGTVQTMIDESISGKAESVSAVSSAEYVSSSTTINFKNVDGDVISSIDASDFVIDGMVESVTITSVTSGQSETQLTWDNNYAELPSGCTSIKADTENYVFYYIYFKDSSDATLREIMITKSGDEITVHTTAFTDCEYSISGTNVYISWSSSIGIAKLYVTGAEKLSLYATMPNEVEVLQITWNSAAGGQVTNIPLSDIFDPSNYYTKQEVDASLSGKQDTLTAGRGIDISANTISFDLPISAGTGSNSIIAGYSGNTASGDYSVAYGKLNSASGECSTANGNRNTANNFAEFSIGQKNVSRTEDSSAFGHSGNTLFSVGNGIINEEQGIDANHNAFEVRGNGEIYISDTNAAGSYYQKPMINLQDTLNGKQDTISAGTNITISGNVISAEGGKAVVAGRGISVTTGATADTVAFNLPIYDRGNTSVSECHPENSNIPSCSSNYCHLEHPYGSIGSNSNTSHKEGYWTKIGDNSPNSHVEGYKCEVGNFSPYSHSEGQYTKTSNQSEHASGQYNASSKASGAFGNSGNTLFSVGNGTSNSARHNAFEIRQNGDIYLSLNGQDVKLQDQLGGGEVSSAITSGDTNAVAGGAVYDKFDEVEQVTAAGLNAVNDKFGGLKLQQITQSAYDALVTKDASTLYVIVN